MAEQEYTYTISTETANGAVDTAVLSKEIKNSTIVIGEAGSTKLGDILTVTMKDSLSTEEETTLNAIVAAHDGIPEVEEEAFTITSQPPFAAKTLPDGRKLYVRESGIPKIDILPGATGSLIYEIPFAAAKINGANIIGCKEHDTVNFKILDTDTGALTTIPLYPVNQFGFNVNMPSGEYYKSYPYDADLFLGLHICIEYTNKGTETVTISANVDMHEVKN